MFNLKDYDIPIDLLAYEFLRFVSYFELDDILPCFQLKPKEIASIKYKIYKQRLTLMQHPDKTEYRVEDLLHREDGPAVVYANGHKHWYMNGNLHRADGPAIEYADGCKSWYLNGKLHNPNGPAIEHPNGSKSWLINGKLHRLNGPAREWANGYKEWHINGIRVPQF